MPFSIRTNDVPPVQIDNFDKIQAVAENLQNQSTIKNAPGGVNNRGQISYKKHTLEANCNAMTPEIPELLGNMDLCNWEGKIYAGNGDSMFQDEFAKYIKFLLTWLSKIETQVNVQGTADVTALQMKDVIMWLKLVMKDVGAKDEDWKAVNDVVKSF